MLCSCISDYVGILLHTLWTSQYVVNCCRIRIDHNEDNSVAIVNEWLNHVRDDYNDVDFIVDESEIGNSFLCHCLHYRYVIIRCIIMQI